MSGELIAIVAVGVTLAGLILTSSRGLRPEAQWCGRTLLGLLAALSAALQPVLAVGTIVLLAVLLTATVEGQDGGLFSVVDSAVTRSRDASIRLDRRHHAAPPRGHDRLRDAHPRA